MAVDVSATPSSGSIVIEMDEKGVRPCGGRPRLLDIRYTKIRNAEVGSRNRENGTEERTGKEKEQGPDPHRPLLCIFFYANIRKELKRAPHNPDPQRLVRQLQKQ